MKKKRTISENRKTNVPRFDPKQQCTGRLAGTPAENDGPEVPASQLHLGVTQEPHGESSYIRYPHPIENLKI